MKFAKSRAFPGPEQKTFIQYCVCYSVIAGEEVERDHCCIQNIENVVTLTPEAGAQCCVNGNNVTEPTKLTQGMYTETGCVT